MKSLKTYNLRMKKLVISMLEKYAELLARLKEVEKILSDPKTLADRSKYQTYAREHASLRETLEKFNTYKKILNEIEEGTTLIKNPTQDPELSSFLKGELED